jgi:rsbT co-antagonist protein RsbR
LTALLKVGNYLKENATYLASEIVNQIVNKFDFEVPNEEIEQAKTMYVKFLCFLGESFNCTEGSVPESLTAWSKENGERVAASQGRISGIFSRYPDTRMVFIDFLMEISQENDLTTEEVGLILKRVNHMLDISINETVYAYERRTEELMKKVRAEMNELSTPVVPIQDGLAVLPLIGSFDYDRTQYLLTKVVPRIPKLHLDFLIIDFSGIITIDIEVASHIFTVYDVLRLLGIDVIVTGIRPELAQKSVHAGIDFSSFKSYANVKQAIESIK